MDELKIVEAKNAKDTKQAAALEGEQAEKWRKKMDRDKAKLSEPSNEMGEIKKTFGREARGSRCAIIY